MISTNAFRKGLRVEINDEPYVIVDFQHVKPGKGNAFTRTKLKNLITGATLEKTLRSGEMLPEADVTLVDHDFLYQDGNKYFFMNRNTYDQIELENPWMETKAQFLTENMRVKIHFHRGQPFDVELPNFVELPVTYCEPGLKGDSATSGTKPATVGDQNIQVQVPLHVKIGDWVKIDTRTKQYVEKVGSKS